MSSFRQINSDRLQRKFEQRKDVKECQLLLWNETTKEWSNFKNLIESCLEFNESEMTFDQQKRQEWRKIMTSLYPTLMIDLWSQKEGIKTKTMVFAFALLWSILLWNADFVKEIRTKSQLLECISMKMLLFTKVQIDKRAVGNQF